MTDTHTDDVLKDLEAALAVTPSPEFAEGVRARIHRESSRRRVWPVWAMAGLAAAAAIVVTIAWPRREAVPAAVAVTAAHEPTPIVSAPPPVAPAVEARPAVTTAAPRASHAVARRAAAPEVLVPPDQALALQALMVGLRDGTIDAASLATPPPDASVPLAPAPKIEIVPIVIPPIDVRAPGAAGGEPVGGIR
jgi:hypothetical protein